jgi:hypothetical protein
MKHCVNTHCTRRFDVRWFVLLLSLSLMACAAEEVDPSDSENQGTDQSVADDTADPSDTSTTDAADGSDASDETDASDDSDGSDTDTSDESSSADPSDDSDTTEPEEVDLSQLDLFGTLPASNLEPAEFVALNRDGSERTAANLVGQPTVMWFYPLANSPG